MIKLISLVLFALLMMLTSCTKKERAADDSEPKPNVIRDYIKVPQDKAKGAKAAVEAKQDEEKQQFEDMDEDK